MTANTPAKGNDVLLHDLRSLIEETRSAVATMVNASLTTLYWRVGKRINEEILKGDRAEYGEKIVHALSAQLQQEYGQGFTKRNLFNMIRFAQVFPEEGIVSALRTQLTWTHFRMLIAIEDPLKRDFYAEMCRLDRWSTRTLQNRMDSMLFERTALSKKPDELIRLELDALRSEDRLTPDIVFRDPYFLDFLGLKDRYVEKDLEDAILRELELFLLELGVGFSFIARQKRIQVDNDDYYLDLLFFHRKLRRLVAIELKLGDFKPADKGQMELYLRWLDKYERQSGEEKPIGLILCAGKKHETVELLELEKSSIRVAEYLTELPPREILERELHKAIAQARQRFAQRQQPKKEVDL
ncbi:MAG: PDDEXK nuclease domain-containing protein [Desulfobacterales bacterium]|jgi:predicted nuclease of restriction endonuclease-like (RecB) superfamily|nr:PDDEXK nuclease domain-containing protein [Desulfobacterales bacterium]